MTMNGTTKTKAISLCRRIIPMCITPRTGDQGAKAGRNGGPPHQFTLVAEADRVGLGLRLGKRVGSGGVAANDLLDGLCQHIGDLVPCRDLRRGDSSGELCLEHL